MFRDLLAGEHGNVDFNALFWLPFFQELGLRLSA